MVETDITFEEKSLLDKIKKITKQKGNRVEVAASKEGYRVWELCRRDIK